METEYWVLSIIAIVLALVAGFVGGRMSAPRQRRVEAMEHERDAAREEAEAVRAEVNRHFEESARMFGKLASDYRTFFQQFAQTAQNLGLSEGRARELLEEADPNLVSRQTARPEGPEAAGDGDAGDRASGNAAAAKPAGEPTDADTGPDEPAPAAGTSASATETGEHGRAGEESPGDPAPHDYAPDRDRRE
jgi:uncharacterized membrane-anchored protein YhcB (DUF1043 family)